MPESICLDVAWTWRVNWHKPDALQVVKLEERNRQAGQSERFGTPFFDDAQHDHNVVTHKTHYLTFELRQGPSYTREHCLHHQQIDELACLLSLRHSVRPPASTAGDNHQATWWRMVGSHWNPVWPGPCLLTPGLWCPSLDWAEAKLTSWH